MSKRMISPAILRQLLCYDPETGKLFWKERPVEMFADGGHSAAHSCAKWNAKHAGSEAFTCEAGGRMEGRIFRRRYFAHRVIWAIVHGRWPEEVDHRDHDATNNKLTNLRECSHQQNMRNQSAAHNSTSSYVGVSWDRCRNKWAAGITHMGKRRGLGRFATEEAAARAYDTAALDLFGDFANLNFPENGATP